jgi:hypothetical protein
MPDETAGTACVFFVVPAALSAQPAALVRQELEQAAREAELWRCCRLPNDSRGRWFRRRGDGWWMAKWLGPATQSSCGRLYHLTRPQEFGAARCLRETAASYHRLQPEPGSSIQMAYRNRGGHGIHVPHRE